MNITIHRGIDQIGGCITEISTATTRIFIDMGDNLVGSGKVLTDDEKKEYVNSLFAQNKRENEAVFFTHSHPDHTGMIDLILESVPKYMSQGTKDVLLIKQKVLMVGIGLGKNEDEGINEKEQQCIAMTKAIKSCRTWVNRKHKSLPEPISLGDIKVTPLYVSHSTYDASMLLVDADCKRILHTGDYRGHGYLSRPLFHMLGKYATDIDYLITEGTMLNREDKCERESALSERMYHAMRAFKYVFVLASSTDIERLQTIFDAADRAERIVCSSSLMHYKMFDYFKRVEPSYRKFDYERFSPTRENSEQIRRMSALGFVMIVGPSKDGRVKHIMEHFDPAQTLLIYSSWDGYYKIPEQIEANSAYKDFREQFNNVIDLHTSGHADASTIAKVIKTVNPREGIIGIHKDSDTSLTTLDLAEDLKAKIIPENKLTACVTIKSKK